jgi:hypothetical protein
MMQCLHCSTGNCEHDKRQVFIRKNETVKFGPHHTFILGLKQSFDESVLTDRNFRVGSKSRELSQTIKDICDTELLQELLDDFEKFLVIRHYFKVYFF